MININLLVEALNTIPREADLIAIRNLSEHEFQRLLFLYRETSAEADRLADILSGKDGAA